VYTGLDQIRGGNLAPAKDGGEAYLVASVFRGSGSVVVYKRAGGGTGLQEISGTRVRLR
jgi:hypothetical protein